MRHPVEDAPLAFCDFTSVDEESLLVCDRVVEDYVGQVYYLKHDPKQKWYWISNQRPNEISMFTSFDSHPQGAASCKTRFIASFLGCWTD
jgi:hypothetical protein